MATGRSHAFSAKLTAGQRSKRPTARGNVAGHMLKIIRERVPLTQRTLAEELGADLTTIQGWESGRRPLAAVAFTQLLDLRRHLLRRGAAPVLLPLLDLAVEADSVITATLAAKATDDDWLRHPLSGWVFNRNATHMIIWALDGSTPTALPQPPASTPRRRGPAPASPLLPEPERRAFFTALRRAAEIADRAGDKGTLLRRQALYLCSYDTSPDTHAWLADMRSRQPMKAHQLTWTPAWSDVRSTATSLTRYGDVETLRAFIARGMSDDAGEAANLNYWAHWLGLDTLPRPDDTFMTRRSPSSWDPVALMRSIADRLDPKLGAIDLNVHSVWALAGSKPGVLSADRSLHANLSARVATLLERGTVSRQARRELESLHYGLRLSSQ